MFPNMCQELDLKQATRVVITGKEVIIGFKLGAAQARGTGSRILLVSDLARREDQMDKLDSKCNGSDIVARE